VGVPLLFHLDLIVESALMFTVPLLISCRRCCSGLLRSRSLCGLGLTAAEGYHTADGSACAMFCTRRSNRQGRKARKTHAGISITLTDKPSCAGGSARRWASCCQRSAWRRWSAPGPPSGCRCWPPSTAATSAVRQWELHTAAAFTRLMLCTWWPAAVLVPVCQVPAVLGAARRALPDEVWLLMQPRFRHA
jgi:hypothetical protein